MTPPKTKTKEFGAYRSTDSDLSTGRVARLLGVSPRTAAELIDRGDLPGWRVGATGAFSSFRRCTLEDVAAFARRTGNRRALARLQSQVLLCGLPDQLVEAVSGGDDIVRVDTLLDLGMLLNWRAGRHTIVIDSGGAGRSESLAAGRVLRQRLPECRLIGLLAEDDQLDMAWMEVGYNDALSWPTRPDMLAAVVASGCAG